jgi:hypothetical protein
VPSITPKRTRATTLRMVRQDLSCLVGVLLLLTVAVTALTGLGDDEAEFFGLGDDLHALAGWTMVSLTVIHIILRWSQVVGYARRRLRSRLGVGGVIQRGVDRPGDD